MSKAYVILAGSVVLLFFSKCNQPVNAEYPASTEVAVGDHEHHALSGNDSAALVSETIVVKGDVQHQLTLTVDSLRVMKTVTLDEFNVVCQSGATMKTDKSSKGVLLRDILEKAGIKQSDHKDRNFFIVARATDNYKATFSWAEIFNNPTGENTYILFEENGKPIAKKGNMILICTNDTKTGPRHVNWLKSIEVTRVN